MTHNYPEMDKAIIGVSLGGKTLMAGKVKDGKIEKSTSKQIDNRQSEDVIISEVIQAIEQVFDDEVAGIGIGVPSLVDESRGIVYKAQNIPSWREVHLKEILENQFGIKTYVNNDANCFAIGEMYFGGAGENENIIGLIIGAGVGAGVIFKGHLYSGMNCGAGEVGAIPYLTQDYEYYLSDSYFEEKYGLSGKVVFNRAKTKDKIAMAILEQYGYHIGDLIKTLMFAYDPGIIILGGSLSAAFPYFEASMWEKIRGFQYPHIAEKIKVEVSKQDNIAVLGAAALYFDAHNHKLIK